MRSLFVLFIGTFVFFQINAQEQITVEKIWKEYAFYPKSVPGLKFQNDGKHYTRKEAGKIVQYDLTSGEQTKVIVDAAEIQKKNPKFSRDFDSYAFSKDEQTILFKTESEKIYRRSSKANYYVYRTQVEGPVLLSQLGKQQSATLSPDGKKVAYVIKNDLYYKDLVTGKETRVTKDGRVNQVINGVADWVYEEEFSFTKAFAWSPDSKRIGFMRFDEKRVKEFTMTLYKDDVYPEYQTFKYPKVGEDNAIVTIHIYDLDADKTIMPDLNYETPGLDATQQIYFPRIKWTKDPTKLCVTKMNRHQNELELIMVDALSGSAKSIYKETNKYYIDVDDDLTFLADGKQFVWTSEKSGFNHIYLYNLKGKEVKALTSGNYDVTAFYGVDEKRGKAYYQAATKNPMQRELYTVDLKSGKSTMLSTQTGTNSAQWSSTYDYFVNRYSNVNQATTYAVHDNSGKQLRMIEDNAGVKDLQAEYGTVPVEFIKIPTDDNVALNASIMKPADFDETKRYPVFMYVYGGPGSQTVKDAFGGFNYWWFQMLTQQGYIVVSVDNRGTGARGEEFKKMTYQQLGKYETIDQINAAKWLGEQSYVDAERIGIFGWSYGGYMSSLCILKGADVFKSAIAVAPVTNWKWYDTIYTERFMRTLKENEDGYRENSPVYFADQLKGNYLIVHGNADDNVHFQNTNEMVNALITANKQFETYFYPNRDHSIFGGNSRLHLYTKMTDFIKSTL